MKKKLIVLCGALVLVVAAVSVTVASRSANSVPDMTQASIEALSQGEAWPYSSEGYYYTKSCSILVGHKYDQFGNRIPWYQTITVYIRGCSYAYDSSCTPDLPC